MQHSQFRLSAVQKILDEVEQVRLASQRKQLNFTAVDEPALVRKLMRVNSPMIVFQSWSGSAAPGGSISYRFGVYNPDPTNWIWLFGSAFIGPANFVSSVGEAVCARDRRFAELTAPSFPGQQVAPGTIVNLEFSMPIPMTAEKTTFQGNTMLFQADWHDVGTYLDRGFWPFDVI